MNFLEFLKNKEPDFKGRYLEDIWKYSNYEIENIHDFVQLAFPLNKPSESVFHGHYLKTKHEINLIKNDKLAQLNLVKSSKWFLNFLELNNNWQNSIAFGWMPSFSLINESEDLSDILSSSVPYSSYNKRNDLWLNRNK